MDEHELRRMMYTAQLPDKGPFVIRYPRGRGVLTDWQCPLEEIPVGKGRCLHEGTDVAVLTIGPIGNDVEQILSSEKVQGTSDRCGYSSGQNPADKGAHTCNLSLETCDLSIAHYDMRFLKPLDEDILHEVGRKFSRIVTIEDGVRNGGLGSAVLEWMSDHGYSPKITRLGLPDNFVEHGTVAELRQIVGLDKESIRAALAP